MDIYSTQFAHKAHALNVPHFKGSDLKSYPETTKPASAQPKDDVKFSQEAKAMSEMSSTSSSGSASPRLDLINRIRSEIAAGTYDTPEKMDSALDRMLSSF